MILVAGAGAMAEAARAMRRIQRDTDRHARRSRERRERRKAKRALARGDLDYDFEPATTDFPCDYLCMSCNYLLDHERYDDASPPPCPGCGETSWVDLRYEELAASIRDMEFEARMSIPRRYRVAAIAVFAIPAAFTLTFISVLSLASAGWVTSSYIGAASMMFGLLSMLLFAPLSWFVGARGIAIYLASDLATEPLRWRLPHESALLLPEVDHDAVLRTDIGAAGESITAPLSGRECVAYEVGVLFDTPGDSRPAQWVLREQRATDVVIDGETIDSGQIAVDGVPAEVPVNKLLEAEALTDDEQQQVDVFRRFLRQRGLFLSDGQYWAYEIVVEPGANCEVAEVEGIRILTPTSDLVEH
jgi:hypothetical protein